MALQALENAMDASTPTKYSKRYEEGYDLQDDVLYNTWVKLKKAAPNTLSKSSDRTVLETNQPLGDITNELKDVLKLPEPRQPKMTTRGTTMLPKHISGEEMIRFLEEKRNKKLQEEEENQRKLDGEQKRLQKEEEKKEREKRKRKADSKKLGKKEQKR